MKRWHTSGDDWVGFSIYEIDPNSGIATFVVQTDLHGLNSMTFDSNDTLYAYAENLGLITLITTDGSATDVNPNFRGPWLATISICFNDEGALYYLDSLLWMMDREKGTAAPIDWMVPNGFWGEAVFVEGTEPQFALWLAGTAGHYMGVKMSGATPNSQVGVAWAKGEGGPTPIPNGYPCAGIMMDLNSNMQQLDIVTADPYGFATVGPMMVHPSAAGLVHLQAIGIATCKTSNKVLLHY